MAKGDKDAAEGLLLLKLAPPHMDLLLLRMAADVPTQKVSNLTYLMKVIGSKLTRENHTLWEVQMLAMLDNKDLLCFVTGLYPLDSCWSTTEQQLWKSIDRFIKTLLCHNMDNKLVTVISKCSTSSSIWTTL
jgi:hypothetical protein